MHLVLDKYNDLSRNDLCVCVCVCVCVSLSERNSTFND